MADYTILSTSVKGNRSSLVVEFPVPVSVNSASVAWQTIVAELRAVQQGQPDAVTTINPRKVADGVYVASLDAGEIQELSMTVEYDAGLPNAGKVAVLDQAVTDRVAAYTVEFVDLYEFYGTDRTV